MTFISGVFVLTATKASPSLPHCNSNHCSAVAIEHGFPTEKPVWEQGPHFCRCKQELLTSGVLFPILTTQSMSHDRIWESLASGVCFCMADSLPHDMTLQGLLCSTGWAFKLTISVGLFIFISRHSSTAGSLTRCFGAYGIILLYRKLLRLYATT